MKLEYKILWFEDQFEEVSEDAERLKEFISDFGFIPEVIHRDKISEQEIEELADELDDYNPYDLIIFDYELGSGSANGLNIAAHLRSKIYTDMIFYSGKVPKELRKLLFDNEVDGVFIVHRDRFYDDIEPIVEDHIKKMSDLNNLRGVVMAATSEMDVQLREGLVSKLESLGEEQQEALLKDTKKKLEKSFAGRTSKIGKIDSVASLLETIKNPHIFDFNRVRLTYLSACEDGAEEKATFEDNSKLHQAINERNKLAHQKAVLSDGKMTLTGVEGSQQYDHSRFTEVRQLLLSAKGAVEKCQ